MAQHLVETLLAARDDRDDKQPLMLSTAEARPFVAEFTNVQARDTALAILNGPKPPRRMPTKLEMVAPDLFLPDTCSSAINVLKLALQEAESRLAVLSKRPLPGSSQEEVERARSVRQRTDSL
jgi:hypothetical protein